MYAVLSTPAGSLITLHSSLLMSPRMACQFVVTPSGPSMASSGFVAVTRVGLDLAKHAFQVHAVVRRRVVVARQLARRSSLSSPTARAWWRWRRAPRRTVAGAARLGTRFDAAARACGPMSGARTTRSAAAICEAAGRPGQRVVPVRSIDNQADLMRHRTRELLAGQRTALLNALRGHLAEIGLVAPQARAVPMD